MATNEHLSMTNYIEYVLMQHLEQIEQEQEESSCQWNKII